MAARGVVAGASLHWHYPSPGFPPTPPHPTPGGRRRETASGCSARIHRVNGRASSYARVLRVWLAASRPLPIPCPSLAQGEGVGLGWWVCDSDRGRLTRILARSDSESEHPQPSRPCGRDGDPWLRAPAYHVPAYAHARAHAGAALDKRKRGGGAQGGGAGSDGGGPRLSLDAVLSGGTPHALSGQSPSTRSARRHRAATLTQRASTRSTLPHASQHSAQRPPLGV
jgi:hypothetical protein